MKFKFPSLKSRYVVVWVHDKNGVLHPQKIRRSDAIKCGLTEKSWAKKPKA